MTFWIYRWWFGDRFTPNTQVEFRSSFFLMYVGTWVTLYVNNVKKRCVCCINACALFCIDFDHGC